MSNILEVELAAFAPITATGLQAGVDTTPTADQINKKSGHISGRKLLPEKPVPTNDFLTKVNEIITKEGQRAGYRLIPLTSFPTDNENSIKERNDTKQPGELADTTGHNWLTKLYPNGRLIAAAILIILAYVSEKFGQDISILFYAAAICTGSWHNFRRALPSLMRLDFNMSVLMSVAVIGAALTGEWREGAVVAFLFVLSEMLEGWTMRKVQRSLHDLITEVPRTAIIRDVNGRELELAVEEVDTGSTVIVRPGTRVPLDGIIIEGYSAFNEAAVTGEPLPVDKGPGAKVYAGSLNTLGVVTIKTTCRSSDTTLARIIDLVNRAQAKKAPVQAAVEKFAAVYTPLVLVLALLITVLPPLVAGAPWPEWIYRGLSLLVVACPCALIISTPVAIISAIGYAARKGVLIKSGIYVEETGRLKAIAFDKTGTLTLGKAEVTGIVPWEGYSADEILLLAAAVEAHTGHHLANAICRAAAEKTGRQYRAAERVHVLPGRGVSGFLNGYYLRVGNYQMFSEDTNYRPDPVTLSRLEKEIKHYQDEGHTVVAVAINNRIGGLILLNDRVRPESKEVIASLRQNGIKHIAMLTGDNRGNAAALARQLKLDSYYAELLPGDKLNLLKKLQAQYRHVAMVGDGINDAPALAAASVGIAMGRRGTDLAAETAAVVLLQDDLSRLPFLIHLSRRTLNIIRQNIFLAVGIKLLALAAVFPGWLTLWLAIFADMGATLIVTLNALRLWRTTVPAITGTKIAGKK